MSDPIERPIHGISGKEAADILGITELSVARLVMQAVLHKPAKHIQYALDRDEVERVSLDRWKPGNPYWATPAEAAAALAVSTVWVRKLAREGRLPAVEHNGRWFFRRSQLELVANAREARRLR